METPKASSASASFFGNVIFAVPAIIGFVKEFASNFFKQQAQTPQGFGVPTVESPDLFSWDWTVEKGMQGVKIASGLWNQLPGSVQGVALSFILYRVWSSCRNHRQKEESGNHVTVNNYPLPDPQLIAKFVVAEFFRQLPEYIKSQGLVEFKQ